MRIQRKRLLNNYESFGRCAPSCGAPLIQLQFWGTGTRLGLPVPRYKLHHPSLLIFSRILFWYYSYCFPCVLENARSARLLMLPKKNLEQLGVRVGMSILSIREAFWVVFSTVLRGLADLTHYLQQEVVNAPLCHPFALPGITSQILLHASPCVAMFWGKCKLRSTLT